MSYVGHIAGGYKHPKVVVVKFKKKVFEIKETKIQLTFLSE